MTRPACLRLQHLRAALNVSTITYNGTWVLLLVKIFDICSAQCQFFCFRAKLHFTIFCHSTSKILLLLLRAYISKVIARKHKNPYCSYLVTELDFKVDINQADENGITPLMHACIINSEEIIRLLFNPEASKNAPKNVISQAWSFILVICIIQFAFWIQNLVLISNLLGTRINNVCVGCLICKYLIYLIQATL